MTLKNSVLNVMTRCGNWGLSHPVGMLVIIMIIMWGAWEYTAQHLSINTDTTELVAPEADFQKNSRQFEKAFPQDMRTLLLVLESTTPELTKTASKRLGQLLANDKTHFDFVYLPTDNAYLRKNGLLYLDINHLNQLSDSLVKAQPFIGRIAEQPNLTGFLSIIDEALQASTTPDKGAVDLFSIINKVSSTLRATINNEPTMLSWESMIVDKTLASTTQFIIVRPKLDYTQIRPAEQAITTVKKALSTIQEPNLPQIKMWITGELGLEDDELSGMSTGTFTASLFSIVLVLVILMLAYRSLYLTLVTLVTLALGMILCGAFAAFAVQELNLISVAFAVSNIGLGVEYAIHFCLRYRDNLAHHISRERAISGTLTSTSPSLLLCAGTTAIGLYAFIPTDYQGVSELGLLAGTSLFICLLVTLTVLPVLLTLIPVHITHLPETNHKRFFHFPEKLANFTLHFAQPIVIIVGILAVLALGMVTQVQTDFNPINLRDPTTDSVIAFKNLIKDKDTTPMTLTVLVNDAAKVKALQAQLSALPSVEKTVSLFDFIPSEQSEKLAIIDDMAETLGLNLARFPELQLSTDPLPSIEHLITTIEQTLPKKTQASDIASLLSLKIELQALLDELNNRQISSRRQFLERVHSSVLGTLPPVMNDLLIGLNAEHIRLEALPPEMRDRWVSKEQLYRIQIFPKQDVNDLDHLEDFITDVQTLAPNATDLPILYWESMKAVVGAFKQAITIALLTIAIVLLIIRRNVTDTLLIMTPLVLAGLFTMASTVITHTPINFANIIALPLLLGFGVDNGIHMVEKLRHSLSEEQNIYKSSTARAMFFGALTTSSSFAGLAFSPHEGIASMGLVITIGIFWIMTSTFIILPALGKLVLKPQGIMAK